MKDKFSSLLADFAVEVGLTELLFDKDELCHLRIDEELSVTIRRDHKHDRLILVGLIAERLPINLDRELIEDLLAMGLGSLGDIGASIGLERNTGTVLLYRCLTFEELYLPQFKLALTEFITLQKEWSEKLGSLGQ